MNISLNVAKIYQPLFKGDYDNKRFIVFYGGRAGGKSFALSLYMIIECLKRRIKVYIVREIEKSTQDSAFSLLKRLINKYDLQDYVLVTKRNGFLFHNGSEIIIGGISERTIENVRSLDNISILWYEESHNLTQEIFNIINPTIRLENSKIFFTLNPLKQDSFMWDFITRINHHKVKNAIAIKANYYDNPFISQTIKDTIQSDFNTLPRDLFLHIWEGEPTNYNDLQVIDISRIGFFDNTQSFKYSYMVLSVDTATSTKTGADYSVIACFAKVRDSKDVHLIHLARGQFDWYTLLNQIQAVYNISKQLTNRNPNLILIEAKSNGLNVIQELQRATHLSVKAINPKLDKMSRVVNSLLPFLDYLKLPLQRNTPLNLWIDRYLRECKDFRADCKHAHDDMIDSTTQALEFLYNNSFDFNKISEALTL